MAASSLTLAGVAALDGRTSVRAQQCLNFFPLPQPHGSFLPGFTILSPAAGGMAPRSTATAEPRQVPPGAMFHHADAEACAPAYRSSNPWGIRSPRIAFAAHS